MDHDKQCVLVIIGADAMGNKDIVGMVDGYRESAQSWKELLLDLKRRGLEDRPRVGRLRRRLALLEGANARFTERPGCSVRWVHKTANVLNQMPKSLQAKAKGHLHDIWMAEQLGPTPKPPSTSSSQPTGANTTRPQSALVKDRERLLSFYDFPAEHWKAHPHHQPHRKRAFATVRLRTVKTKGCLSRKTALAMAASN